MNVSTLILELQKFQEEHGDLQVRAYVDHGQTAMNITAAGVGYIEEDSYMPESLCDEDEDFDEGSCIKICEVWG
ncbi:hypothetical protein NVP1063O_179 [Vibrio phage 1.063.O._10N.261.45.C7]|nr:hypothetical protein NVP1063O_179 [Vibrio phage 1.063.O._10N.261.45.C7]